MSSEAKRKANAKYLQSMKTLTLRVKPEEAEEIKRAAGNSVQGYIISAVRERMAAESQEGVTVCTQRCSRASGSGRGAKYQGVCNAGNTRAHGARIVKNKAFRDNRRAFSYKLRGRKYGK